MQHQGNIPPIKNQIVNETEKEIISVTLRSFGETIEDIMNDKEKILPEFERNTSAKEIDENDLLLEGNVVDFPGVDKTLDGSEAVSDKNIGMTVTSHKKETSHDMPSGLISYSPRPSAKESPSQKVKRITKNVLREITIESKVIDPRKEARLAKFHSSELILGNILGEGAFGTVFEINNVSIDDKGIELKMEKPPPRSGLWKKVFRSKLDGKKSVETDTTSTSIFDTNEEIHDKHRQRILINNQDDARLFIATHCCRAESPGDLRFIDQTRYALKRLSPRIIRNDKRRTAAVVDLAIESRFLSSVEHPNIIKIRGLAKDEYIGTIDFFIVLDKLAETLEERIHRWSWIKSDLTQSILVCCRSSRLGIIWEDQIHVAYDIAAAIKYLHELKIIYRDLKPENIGFDIRGDVKIFDFGLAKELKPEMIVPPDDNNVPSEGEHLYKLTGRTGTMRYMAPEVVHKMPYNHKCDVFSFGILLWEICSLKDAFSDIDYTEHMRRIIVNKERPSMPSEWSSEIKSLLNLCWADRIKDRCDFKYIYFVLRGEFAAGDEKKVGRLDHTRRRSTYVQAYTQPLEFRENIQNTKNLHQKYDTFEKDEQE